MLEYGEQSLRTLLDSGRLQESACRTLTERLLQLVRHLHSRGVVHTDLRAEHVFLLDGELGLGLGLRLGLGLGQGLDPNPNPNPNPTPNPNPNPDPNPNPNLT